MVSGRERGMRTAAIDIGGTMIKSGVWDGTRLDQIKGVSDGFITGEEPRS